MLTSQDVRSVQFEKNLRGYRTEEVDRFLDKVEEQLRQDDALAEELRKQIADLTAENQRLHEEMKNYEADGDMLRANLRGDDIIRDANELLQKASDRADEIINEANDKKLAEEREYDRVRLEVTRFKSDVLNLYRSHVESLSRLPEFQKEEPEAAEPAVEEKAEETTAAALTEEIEQAQPETDAAPADEETAEDDKSEDFWSKDESQLKIKLDPSQAPVGAEEEEEPAEPDYAAFKGVKFSE